MASKSPLRLPRRAAARKNIIVEDSDEEPFQSPIIQDKSAEDEFTPAPQRSPQRNTRRKTANISTTPLVMTRTRKSQAAKVVDPSQIFEPEEGQSEHVLPTKKTSPRKRKSTAMPKKSYASTTTDPPLPIPIPEKSVVNDTLQVHGTPLADITKLSINEQVPAAESQKLSTVAQTKDSFSEKPMEIVIRSRTLPVAETTEPSGPKPRIVIKYLVLTNFKSYAGRQEVGPFHASFSSVVGPNGSGKSNVIDSLLFVFGFRASKMRQGKISALIHNSATFPNLEFCEVEVYFEEVIDLPNGSTEIVPNSTLVISRKAFKNNSSKYYINSKESNFTMVTSLLKDRGVDLDHKRFLILQGEVESIAQMKPKASNEHDDGLLEYLEDIIGTSKYKTPIEESAHAVDALNEVCAEKDARARHVEKEKNGLEDKKSKALAFIQDENQLASKQSALYQIYIGECNDNLKVTEEAIEQTQDRLNVELEKHRGNEQSIKELEAQYKRETKEHESMQKAVQAVLKEMAKYDKEHVKYEEKKKFLTTKQSKLNKALHSSKLSSSEAKSLIQKYADDVERNTNEIGVLEKSLRDEENELAVVRNGMKGKTQAFSDRISEKQQALDPWIAKINEKQSAIAVAQSELDILRERTSAEECASKEVQERIQNIEKSYEEKKSEVGSSNEQRIQLEKKAHKTRVELEELRKKEPELRLKLSNARQRVDEAKANLSAAQNQGSVISGLNRLKESGRIDGFHGRLGNLGTIDRMYDVAISTACPSLDNLVVDTVEVGQQCIDYLRKNNLGRANIILLDRLTRRDLSLIETPEGVPRLFDLVKSKDEIFRPAFYSVLQNTLVAKDLDQANRIAYGARRWRVVTLDGQLIDVSGTMSGGGTRVARGGMSSKFVVETSNEQASKLELDQDRLDAELKALQDRQQELEAMAKDIIDQIMETETLIQKAGLETESLKRNLADACRCLTELNAAQRPSQSNDARIAKLEKQISGAQRDVESLRLETSCIEDEIKNLQDKIMEVGGVRLRGQKAKVDGLREQIETLTEDISNAEVAKSKSEKQKTKLENLYSETEQELAMVVEELEHLAEEIKNQESDASNSLHQAEQAQEALDTKKEDLITFKRDLDEKRAALNEIRAVEIEMRNRLEENQKILAENHKRSKYWVDKLSKLSLRNFSNLGEEQEPEELQQYSKDELVDMDKEVLNGDIAALEEKTQNVGVELDVLAEYRRRVEEYATRANDLQTALASRDNAKKRCDELRKLRLEGFMQGFSLISLRLKEMYQMITMGGNAELELVDSLDPFSEGILFSVMPPKKSWKNISNLSGGEKTLSSLALVFALHHYKPTPLYVMDEIDAALDFRNVSIVASYIKERTKNAQFIVISLRNNMFELASRLVGVYKVNHMKTKSVAVENRDYITGRA